MKYAIHIFLLIIILACYSCTDTHTNSLGNRLFTELDAKQTGITFINKLTESDSINYFKYGYMYMGGGVSTGDLNNDGLDDIYFTGNMVENKLYLNRGNLNFEDVTAESGLISQNLWHTGVTMADVNADGWMDIYVCVSGIWASKKNLLYINQGLNDNGIPVFKERAIDYGLADEGQSIQATFFDYDNDNDLDVYVVNYPVTSYRTTPKQYVDMMNNVTDQESNTLYRNNGNNTFTDVTEIFGLKSFGLSLSSAIGDFNDDGFMDIYVSNDFATPDNFYFNNGDGTFTDHIKETINQASFFGMGTDVSDFNNDGLLDLFQLDMSTKDNRRSKANMQSMNIGLFEMMDKHDFHTQYMENALQLNIGSNESNLPQFSNISRLANVSLSDWSWAGLFADFDNDGLKDLFVTNGTKKEINNKDYLHKINEEHKNVKDLNSVNLVKLVNEMPSEKIANYAFKNNGNLTFDDVSEDWGLGLQGFSNGTAYADLDNDGDLEIIVNNLDSESKIFKNNAGELSNKNYLKISFKGHENNPAGIGTRVELYSEKGIQMQELMLSRGFQSSVSPNLHFGLGDHASMDSLVVTWPDGISQTLTDITANNHLVVDYSSASFNRRKKEETKDKVFENISSDLDHIHTENYFDDYRYQILLPHKMSQDGPALAIGDIDNDGLEDFFIGSASGHLGCIYKQHNDGSFKSISLHDSWDKDKTKEDIGAVFFDANNDGFQDLYVVSGGNEFYKNTRPYQDRLYLNDSKGNFIKAKTALPKNYISGSKVIPADYDLDGDIDLFIGGRHTPRNYPLPTSSFILRNDSSGSQVKFTDVTAEIAPQLKNIGMVTNAVWTDFNNDDHLDLVVVGEWMPITFFQNYDGLFKDVTREFGFEKSTGWWNSIIAKDFDRDGDVDFIAGNLGLNYKYKASEQESFDIYADDFDNNKSTDIVLGYYYDGEQFPVRGRQCSSEQIPAIKIKFKDYNSFAEASLADVYSTGSLESALHYRAFNFATSYIENLGDGKFKIKALPNEAQFSSVNNILTKDLNGDGYLDLVLSGNLYNSEVETPRNDASHGLYLEGDGNGNFRPIPSYKSGLYVKGDVKNAGWIQLTNEEQAILFAKNNDAIQMEKILKSESEAIE